MLRQWQFLEASKSVWKDAMHNNGAKLKATALQEQQMFSAEWIESNLGACHFPGHITPSKVWSGLCAGMQQRQCPDSSLKGQKV
jgi:hypothetical protein